MNSINPSIKKSSLKIDAAEPHAFDFLHLEKVRFPHCELSTGQAPGRNLPASVALEPSCGKVSVCNVGRGLSGAWTGFISDLEEKYGQYQWFGHFTFAEPLHPEQANKRWMRFVREINTKLYGRRFREHGDGITWARGQENQRRDAIHFHGFFGNGVKKLRRLDFMDIWQGMCEGYCRIWPYDGKMNAVSYITKYVVKEGDIDVFVPNSLLKLN